MKFQAPKGTRDFYPDAMAWRNYIIDAWRRASIRNGFEQVDGPIFETLDLYKVKSGEGIVSELFHFEDRGGRDLAIRPEFTPTLTRMVAAQANALPKPIKWFATPNFCRAEKPQRGRLREFWQWNVDILGLDDAVADAEVIFTAVDLLSDLGLRPDQVKVKISHRTTVRHILSKMGVADEKMTDAFNLLDRRDKMPPEEFTASAGTLGLSPEDVQRFEQVCRMKYRAGRLDEMREHTGIDKDLEELFALDAQLGSFGIHEWCEYDLGIVRGLAYYTGAVFEIHEITGMERALAGGGRYDNLIELFDGPKMSAVGFGMGDVVLTNTLMDKDLVPAEYAPVPDAFVVAASDYGAKHIAGVVAQLRKAGLHARMSYKATRNIGKLLKEAGNAHAHCAIILDDKLNDGVVELKDMASGEQSEVSLSDLASTITHR